MADINPYEPAKTIADPTLPTPAPTRSTLVWALVGLFVGAAIPAILGILSIRQEAAYNAALPEMERNGCGMGGLAALMVIVIGSPLFGCIGALSGFLLSKITPKF